MAGVGRLVSVLFRRRAPGLPSLDARIACFREVLHANNAALGFLADIQQVLAGERRATMPEVRRLVAGMTVQTYRMLVNLNRMTGERFPGLAQRFDEIRRALGDTVEVTPALREVGFVVPLAEADASLAEVIGQKSAFLGEARRTLPDAVPDGFAITAHAYRTFLGASDLGERIRELLTGLAPGDVPGCFSASAAITQAVESAPVPAPVAEAIEAAVARLGGDGLRVAVRSSALQEGGYELSFAGQYRSLLNVPPRGVVDAFRRVVASTYSPEAITYRLGRGFDHDEVAMCCCVVVMVDAVSAGVMYSACETPAGPRTLVQAVRGLGLAAVDGSAEPDSFAVDRAARRVAERTLGSQATRFVAAGNEGTEREAVAESGFILTDRQALALAELAWRLEEALGRPVDVEWAIDGRGDLRILQVRPQPPHVETRARRRPPLPGQTVLLEGGSPVCRGVAAGRVCRVTGDLSILRCPPGAVVVTGEASPRLAVLLPRAAAIVADMGETTGHLATVARELRVPALFATRSATAVLKDGEEVTVDAEGAAVYAGRVEALLAQGPPPAAAPRDPTVERLAAAAPLLVPLTLRDRLASGYSPTKCRTLHDIVRFCHQRTVEAMFTLGDRAVRGGGQVRRLVSAVPIDCRVIDLGGGVAAGAGAGAAEVRPDDLACVPMRALWRGMTDPRVAWNVTKPVSLSGFASALVNYNFDPDARMRAMGEPSYAFVTATYLNLNSRIGYHFSTVDANIGERVESNHVSFRFVGGSTGIDQRSRRASLIQRLLAASGFETDCRADLVNARLRHRPAAEMERALELVGLLMTYANHLDMVLATDGIADEFAAAFLAGDYGFKGGARNGRQG